ncbi:hypothetical protein ACONUD_01295 [Microbulbifer harenosus]|uniref:Lipoprotein n=1 Tax=Microbulbifer harenosus TaxID=2576840 RepID=A0ABY2UMQ8_9GAMM|nr:hypothetical protein [Microbulbifer harenosus]TLM79537.1 hypothetical protein FDY93_01285 [Microbulbifer harenosus]
MFGRNFVLFSVACVLTACASEPTAPNPGLKESFHTEISANGSKRFTYALEMAVPELRGPYTENPNMRGGMTRTDGMRRASRGQRMDINYALDLKLKETRFCRDGYFVIDRVVSQHGGEIRGECRDGAEQRVN